VVVEELEVPHLVAQNLGEEEVGVVVVEVAVGLAVGVSVDGRSSSSSSRIKSSDTWHHPQRVV